MKKIISLILAVVLIICSLPIVIISMAADSNADFMVTSAKTSSTSISGDAVNGYTMSVTGTGLTSIMTKDEYPIKNLSFDYGYKRTNVSMSYGEFGITTKDNVDELAGCSGSDTLTFRYYAAAGTSGNRLDIYVVWAGKAAKLIGKLDFADYRPADGYWNPNVSNFSFVKVGAHWHLAVDGNVCNNVAENFDYSCLENMVGESFFEDNTNVHIYVGGYHAAGTGTAYFKQLSSLSEDGVWESRAVDSYKFTHGGKVNEFRGQGNTSETIHSAIPASAIGTKEDGHTVDFTGTDGYAQTTIGLNLKTAKIHVTPSTTATVSNTTNNVFNYYIGFTSDPSDLQYHTVKPNDSIEFHAWNVNSDGTTYGKVITNQGCLATPTEEFGAVQRLCYYRTLNTEGFVIDFVKDEGPDGEFHWYMRTSIGGQSITVKGTADNDAYFQFDNIIDKPVYFRMGTHNMIANNFKMHCKIDSWPIDDETLTDEEKEKIAEIEERIAAIGEVTEENYKTVEEELKNIREEYEALSVAAQAYVPIVKLEQKESEVASIRELVECGDWYVANSATTYTGDKWINYTFANSLSSGQNLLATTSKDYDITKNSLYWKGINIPGGSWFLFGLTQDMQLGMFPSANDNGIHFILRPKNNAIQVSFWNPTTKTEDPIGDSSQCMYNEFEYYNTSKVHYFTMVKQDGHWYLKIDDIVFDGECFDVIDNYMEQYGEATKVRFGAYGGLGQCEVNIIDPTVDDSVVPDEIADEVKAFDDKVNALGGIAAITEDNYSEMRTAVDELLRKYEALHSRVKKYVTTKDLLDAMEERLNLMKQAESLGEWKTSLEELTYAKNKDGSYDFSSVLNKGFGYAITTSPYDFTKMGFEWSNIYTPPGTWFTFGLTADYNSYSLSGTGSKKSIIFIITPSNNDVYVRYWDPDSRKEVNLLNLLNSKYTGFNYYTRETKHSFGFTKGNDGHWYLYIDNMLFNDNPIEAIDNFMETYGESAYVMFGAYKGADVCNVNITEMEYTDGSVTTDATNIKGVLTQAQKYLQLLEENYVAIWEYNASMTAKLFEFWNTLDYRAQLEVEATLMDDDYMWEIHDLVATYSPELYTADIFTSGKTESNSSAPSEISPDSSDISDSNSDSSDTNNLNSGSSNTKKPNTNSSNKKDSNSNLIKILILSSVLIIVLAVFLIIGYKVYKKSKKTN